MRQVHGCQTAAAVLSEEDDMARSADFTAYLRRLGVASEPPSADALARLHRAHVERIPYETFWIHLREGWGIGADESVRHIAHESRGGYCFQLNGAFAALLTHLGYQVTRHVAGVHNGTGPDEAALKNHAALIVRGCASEANPEGAWYVDTGLGDALHEPLPLRDGVFAQGPTRFGLAAVRNGVGDWHFTHDQAGSFAGVSIVAAPTQMGTFRKRHVYNSTSAQSSFARTVTAQRRDASGAAVLRGCVFSAKDTSITCASRAEWLDLLADEFGLRLSSPAPMISRLWTDVRRTHDEWLASAQLSA
jgi:arylamine N-acetyltransferase